MDPLRPSSITRWLAGPPTDCPCGREHQLGLREILLGPGALDRVGDILPRPEARAGPLLLLADRDTYEAAGARAGAVLRSSGQQVRETVLGLKPHADDRALAELRPALSCNPSRIVAVGSGTINDLGKALAAEAGIPLLTVGTAASMNGYTSSIAAITVSGLKMTLQVRPADILVLDMGVIAAAPARLNRAGFGDLMSKPVSSADWLLSQSFFPGSACPTALAAADEAVGKTRARAREIGLADPDALAALTEGLVLSGISMSLAGASSPASGAEHLISHYLDISASGWRREPRLHGEQVAVGTMVSLAVYGRLRAAGAPGAGLEIPPEESPEMLAELHSHLSPPALAALLEAARAKAARVPGRAGRVEILSRSWNETWTRLDGQLRGCDGLASDLSMAGVPMTFGQIDVPRKMAARLIRVARHMRNRYTVLDLAADLGRLDGWSEEIAGELAA